MIAIGEWRVIFEPLYNLLLFTSELLKSSFHFGYEVKNYFGKAKLFKLEAFLSSAPLLSRNLMDFK